MGSIFQHCGDLAPEMCSPYFLIWKRDDLLTLHSVYHQLQFLFPAKSGYFILIANDEANDRRGLA